MNVAAILLAAGAGTRMGGASPKLLLDYRGDPLVCHAAKAALRSRCEALYIVVGDRRAEIETALAGLSAEFVENPDWKSGLASSIRTGVAVASETGFDAVLVMLGDQPQVTSAHLDAILDSHRRAPDRPVASRYSSVPSQSDTSQRPKVEGVPALFPRRNFEALMQLRGDSGARALLLAERAVAIPFEPAGADVDTPDDYATLLRDKPR